MSNKSPEHINENLQEISASATSPSLNQAVKTLGVDINMAFIEADTFNGDPYDILGNVIEIRKVDGVCPPKLNAEGAVIEFSPYKIPGALVKESTKIKEPIKRASIVVDKKLSADISFLNYLNSHFEGESSFSIIVFDQNGASLDRDVDSWRTGVERWKVENKDLFTDPDICYLFAIIGFVQKYIIRKRYAKYSGNAQGGAFGLNLNGELYTSDESYSLDIIYGILPVVLKRPSSETKRAITIADRNLGLTDEESFLFRSLSTQKISRRK